MTSFTIIPVLDLKHGAVVRARAGDRANYRPIVSPLAAGSNPDSVLRGLLGLAPFPIVYIADLDAIAGEGDHRAALWALAEATPQVSFWIDGGFTTLAASRSVLRPGIVPVLTKKSGSTFQNFASSATVGWRSPTSSVQRDCSTHSRPSHFHSMPNRVCAFG